MTRFGTIAWSELEWSTRRRSTLSFGKSVQVGQLVFKFDDSTHEWTPYWVVDENDGLYELIAAYGDERIDGVPADKLGIAVNADGETYNKNF